MEELDGRGGRGWGGDGVCKKWLGEANVYELFMQNKNVKTN